MLMNNIRQFFAKDASTNVFLAIISNYITFIYQMVLLKGKSGHSHQKKALIIDKHSM